MVGLRVSSPSAWLTALVLFFLPWVNLSCRTQDGRNEEVIFTFSGAQLAWGGATTTSEGGPSRYTLADLSGLRDDAERLLAGCFLSLYALGLAAGVWFACTRPPGVRRARVGSGIALVLLGLLVAGCWAALGESFRSGFDAAFVRGGVAGEARFTAWYYGSYLADLWALASFAVEYRFTRPTPAGAAPPRFAPGPRLSALDVAVLVTTVLASVACGAQFGWMGLALAFVVGHFFLFCNVFRLSRALELVWAAVFVTLALGTLLFDRPGWPLTLAGTLAATALVVALEIRKPSYHGIGWQWINPGLRGWWEGQAARTPESGSEVAGRTP